jgi:hypothetical protein
MGIALMATSLNYWRRPDMASYRKTMDMIVAKGSILYHVWLSTYTKNTYLTTLPMVFGILCYGCSLYLYDKGEYEMASNLHVALHVLVSMGASMTYMELSNIGGVENTGLSLGLV